jgi:hypothetical protein
MVSRFASARALRWPCRARHDHSQVKALDREGDELHRREFGGKAMKRLELHQNILRDGTGHLVRRRPQLEAPTAVLVAREGRCDIGKVFVAQTDNRTSHERAEGQRVQRIRNRANKNKDVSWRRTSA